MERPYPSIRAIWLGAVAFVVVGALSLLILPNMLLHNWFPGTDETERRKLLASAAQIILFSLGGLIAVVGVALSLLRHRQELEANSRDRAHANRLQEAHESEIDRARQASEDAQAARTRDAERELRARFVQAIDLLSSSDSATRRAAAMHALGALADDWLALQRDEEAQVCIDMLCTYLRSPSISRPSGPDESMVRRVGYGILRSHLLIDARNSWSRFPILLTDAYIDFDVDLSYIRIANSLDLRGLTIASRGRLRLNNVSIEPFRKITLRGVVLRDNAGLDFSSSTLRERSSINLRGAQLVDKSNLYLRNISLQEHADINLLTAVVKGDGRIHLRGTTIGPAAKVRVRGDLKWTPSLGTSLGSRELPQKATPESEAGKEPDGADDAQD